MLSLNKYNVLDNENPSRVEEGKNNLGRETREENKSIGEERAGLRQKIN